MKININIPENKTAPTYNLEFLKNQLNRLVKSDNFFVIDDKKLLFKRNANNSCHGFILALVGLCLRDGFGYVNYTDIEKESEFFLGCICPSNNLEGLCKFFESIKSLDEIKIEFC